MGEFTPDKDEANNFYYIDNGIARKWDNLPFTKRMEISTLIRFK